MPSSKEGAMLLTRNNARPSWMLIALAAIVAFGLFLQAVAPTIPDVSHAFTKHGSDALLARQCMDGRDSHLFHNPTTNRFGTVCEIDGKWAVVITDAKGNEITA